MTNRDPYMSADDAALPAKTAKQYREDRKNGDKPTGDRGYTYNRGKRNEFRACGEMCASGFRTDRQHGAMYGPFKYRDGTFAMCAEEWSRKLCCCVYCNEDLRGNERRAASNVLQTDKAGDIDMVRYRAAAWHVARKTTELYDSCAAIGQIAANLPWEASVRVVYHSDTW